MKSTAAIALLSGLLAFSSLTQASLINPDFSAGFLHWQAEVSQFNSATGQYSMQSGDIQALFPDSFLLNGDQLTLQTAMTEQDEEAWSMVMFQDFTLSPATEGEKLLLTFELDALLTDGGADDFYFAQLRDLDSNDVLDLSAGGSFDISAFASRNLSLEFGVQDMDFVLGDQLQIRALSLNSVAAAVPSAGALSLFVPMLLWLGFMQRRSAAWRRSMA